MTKRRIRVVQVIPALYHGGAEHVVEALCHDLDRDQFESVVCCTRALGPVAERIEQTGVRTTLAASHPYLSPWHVGRSLAALAPDIVHTHGLTSLLQVAPAAALRQIPRWVHTYHFGNYPYKKSRHMRGEQWCSRLPDRLIAVADAQKANLVRFHGLAESAITTIPNGVPANRRVGDVRHRREVRDKLGLSHDAPVVVTAAVLTEQKGVTVLLQAAETILAQQPSVQFVVIGGGPLEEPLRQEAEARGISGSVRFTGWRSDVPELLPAMDIFVMASLWEAMPLALLEAMAAQLQIVVTDVGENRRIIDDGTAGLLVPPRSPEAIATAVLRLLKEPETGARLSSDALRLYEQNFSTAQMIARYEALYRGLMVPRN